ncbi:hypothetical protein ACQEV4_14995 [Streptomyces shenzhenensis]|uniref:hypothetical protein n=1 Tax=Streptomyces shenzhenensis TaxID=943815 RepID=UPI003D8E22F3
MTARWAGVGEPRTVGPQHARPARAPMPVRDWLMLAALPTLALTAVAGVTQARAVDEPAIEELDQPPADGLDRAAPNTDRVGPRPELRR